MSSLEDLKKRIYRPSAGNKLTDRLHYQYEEKAPKAVAPKEPFLTPKRKKFLKLVSAGFFILLVFVIGLFWLAGRSSFSEKNITIELDGLQKIESGEFLKYDFKIRNNNSLAMEEAKLIIEYPKGSSLQNPERKESTETIYLERIPGKSSKIATSYVKIFGPEDSKDIIGVTISYLPARLNTKLEKKTEFAVDIISSPLKIVIDEPSIITLNKDIVYTVNFSNRSTDSFKDVRLKIEYPEGFDPNKFSPRNPDISNHTWTFVKVLPQEEYEFKITGRLTQTLDVINLSAFLELKGSDGKYQSYTQAYSAASFTPAPIAIDIQTTNLGTPGIVRPESEVELIVNFQNTTDSVLRDILLSVKLDGEIFDQDAVYPEDLGIYYKDTDTIVWDGRRIDRLAILGPFEAGSAKFKLKIKKSLTLDSFNDKNFTLNVSARIRPNVIPPELTGIELENDTSLSVRLNSVLKLNGSVLASENQPLSTSGPMPPVASQKTSFLVTWQLLNYYNDLKNVSVEAYLPPGIDWEDSWWPKNNNITFDPLTGKILWQIEELKAGTGFTSPVRQIIFKLSVIPSPSQVGSRIDVLGESTAYGKDTFTDQNLQSTLRYLRLSEKVEK